MTRIESGGQDIFGGYFLSKNILIMEKLMCKDEVLTVISHSVFISYTHISRETH